LLAQNAKNHLDNKSFRADSLAALARIANEMQRLIDRLSMVKTGHEMQDHELCNPSALAFEVLDDLQLPANVDLRVDIPALPNAVWVKDQIRTVLRNLFLNAIEAMPKGGRLSVKAKADHSQIQFSISDTGIGITEDFIRHRLFKPHQTTKSKGLGIGLYQSKEMTSAHNGRIHVTSQPNQGATFEVILPLRPESIVLHEAPSLPVETSTRAEKISDPSRLKLRALVTV
jgi:signal transduction histidine kinase